MRNVSTIGIKFTHEELHFGYFFVHLLHELNDEIDEFMFQHLFGMKVCN